MTGITFLSLTDAPLGLRLAIGDATYVKERPHGAAPWHQEGTPGWLCTEALWARWNLAMLLGHRVEVCGG